jgi:hypothetical protein
LDPDGRETVCPLSKTAKAGMAGTGMARTSMTRTSMARASTGHRGKVLRWLSEGFALNASGLNWPRGVMFLDVALVPVVAAWATGYEQYLLSAIFGALLTVLVGPGGPIRGHTTRLVGFALVGAGVTALGFGLGGAAWGWLVLAGFVVTLLAGLAVTFGAHGFVAGLLLNARAPGPAPDRPRASR